MKYTSTNTKRNHNKNGRMKCRRKKNHKNQEKTGSSNYIYEQKLGKSQILVF